jgi:hypothetical protein
MPLEDWANGVLGNTPLDADRLNARDRKLQESLVQLVRDPESLFAGYITRDADGAPISAVVEWPDKEDGQPITGTYSGVASVQFPGSINRYTITRVTNTGTVTYTQPTVTRDGVTGQVVNRPPIEVS